MSQDCPNEPTSPAASSLWSPAPPSALSRSTAGRATAYGKDTVPPGDSGKWGAKAWPGCALGARSHASSLGSVTFRKIGITVASPPTPPQAERSEGR